MIYLALGYLYSSVSLNALNPGNARAVLAAGCLLGGMDDFCHYAYQACRNSITVETINDWIDFVDHIAPTPDGAATPMQRTSVLGPYALQLRNDVFQFLVVTLPDILEVHTAPAESQVHNGFSSGRETLLQIFSRVPFDLFKSAMESPAFRVGRSFFPGCCVRYPAVDFHFWGLVLGFFILRVCRAYRIRPRTF